MSYEDYMKRALELAETAMGHTSPNPMVGCVVMAAGPPAEEPEAEETGEDDIADISGMPDIMDKIMGWSEDS